MSYLAIFFAGAFLCNAIPHLTSGLQGLPFPSPFATPRGVGDSSALVNVLWGFFNFLVGCALLSSRPIALEASASSAVFVLGALVMGINAAVHFGKVQSAKQAKNKP
jgi:hypothetical protein